MLKTEESIDRVLGELIGVDSWALTVYRTDTSAVSRSLDFGDISGVAKDNYVTLTVDAEDSRIALSRTTDLLESYLRHLSVMEGRVYSHEPRIIQDANNGLHRIPQYVNLMRSSPYDLDTLSTHIEKSVQYTQLEDSRLDRGLEYFEHALLLYEKREKIAKPFSRHHRYLVSAVFLEVDYSTSR